LSGLNEKISTKEYNFMPIAIGISNSIGLLFQAGGTQNTSTAESPDVISHNMRLQNHCIHLLFVIFFLSLSSCGEKTSHEKEVSYFASIAIQLKDIVPKVHAFWKEMKQGVITATQNQDHKLDKFTLDSLKTKLAIVIKGLDQSINKINSLNETDSQLDLKHKVSFFLQETKEMQISVFSKVLKILETGIDKVTDQDKETLNQFKLNLQGYQNKSKEVEDLSLEFQKKHNINNKELVKYGL
jgi:CRISPR/Cas system CSM-associated protein Csm2 small subunit